MMRVKPLEIVVTDKVPSKAVCSGYCALYSTKLRLHCVWINPLNNAIGRYWYNMLIVLAHFIVHVCVIKKKNH